METFCGNYSFRSQDGRQFLPNIYYQSHQTVSDNVAKFFASINSSGEPGRTTPPFCSLSELSDVGNSLQQAHAPQTLDMYRSSKGEYVEPSSLSASSYIQSREPVIDNQLHANSYLAGFDHKECNQLSKPVEFQKLCSTEIETLEHRTLVSELNSSNSTVSSEVNVDSDLQWLGDMGNINTRNSSLSDVTSLAIFAALNCGHDEAFPIELFSAGETNDECFTGSRKNSHDSGCVRDAAVNSQGSFDLVFKDDFKTLYCGSKSTNGHELSTEEGFNQHVVVTTCTNRSPSSSQSGSPDRSALRNQYVYTSTSTDPHNRNGQDSSLGRHDSLGIQSRLANTSPWQQQFFGTQMFSHLTADNQTESSQVNLTAGSVLNKQLFVGVSGPSMKHHNNILRIQGETGDRSSFQHYRQDKVMQREYQKSSGVHPVDSSYTNTLSVKDLPTRTVVEIDSFFDEFIDIVCKPPSTDSEVVEPCVSPLIEAVEGRDFQSRSSPSTEDSRDQVVEPLQQFLKEEPTSAADRRTDGSNGKLRF